MPCTDLLVPGMWLGIAGVPLQPLTVCGFNPVPRYLCNKLFGSHRTVPSTINSQIHLSNVTLWPLKPLKPMCWCMAHFHWFPLPQSVPLQCMSGVESEPVSMPKIVRNVQRGQAWEFLCFTAILELRERNLAPSWHEFKHSGRSCRCNKPQALCGTGLSVAAPHYEKWGKDNQKESPVD